MAQYGAARLSHGVAWISHGAAWLSLWCGVAQYDADGSVWCGVAQLVARRLAVRQAEFVSPLSTTGRCFPLSIQTMRKWREASANGDG